MTTDTHAIPEDTGLKTRVLVATNGSAGSGKSTFSGAVAYAAAKHKKKVCVIGLDKQRDVSRLLGYDDPDADPNLPTLYDVIDKLFTLTEAVVPARNSKTKQIIPNLWVVLESKKLDPQVRDDLLRTCGSCSNPRSSTRWNSSSPAKPHGSSGCIGSSETCAAAST